MWPIKDPRFWNTTAQDLTGVFGCDTALSPIDDVYARAMSVAAPAAMVFQWLCQLRVAPYSYDIIDNLGRKSPRTRTEGLAELSGGERFMYIFELVSFEQNRAITIKLSEHPVFRFLFGRCAITYRVDPGASPAESRIVAKLALHYPRGPFGWLMRAFLPRGDLIMMRKQLLTLKSLAEVEARAAASLGNSKS